MDQQLRWLPPQLFNHNGQHRRVGIELELADITPSDIARTVQAVLGGQVERHSVFEYSVINTQCGDFTIELDASYLKAVGDRIEHGQFDTMGKTLESIATEILAKAAEQFVPWELVTPPIPITDLQRIHLIVEKLRDAGALGTRSSIFYAFGTHLNPELPSLDVTTILNYFRAFLCLYDWIVTSEQIDLTRKLTTYIKHFNKDYILCVLSPDYKPTLTQFMDDYMEANPSRNRSMDLLPLFCFLDEARVRAKVADPRVKARPTLHYRLPNCDVDNPSWNIDKPWQEWLQVEYLAEDSERLKTVCDAYSTFLQSFFLPLEPAWDETVKQWLV